MLDYPHPYFPCEIEPSALFFYTVYDSQTLDSVMKTSKPMFFGQRIKNLLPHVPKWGMTKVMAQSDSLGQVLVEPEGPGYRPRDLGDFKCVCEPCPVVVAFRQKEDLGLIFEPPEGLAVYYPVPVSLENYVIHEKRFSPPFNRPLLSEERRLANAR